MAWQTRAICHAIGWQFRSYEASPSVQVLYWQRKFRERHIRLLPVVISDDELMDNADGQEHPQRVRRQRQEPIAFVKCLAARNAVGIATVEHIKHDDGDADGVGRNGNPAKSVDKQIAARQNQIAGISGTEIYNTHADFKEEKNLVAILKNPFKLLE